MTLSVAGLDHDIQTRLQASPLVTASYTDRGGLAVESIWACSQGLQQPPLVFIAYIDKDHPPVTNAELYTQLNNGLLRQVSWSLHTVRDHQSLDHAFSHHSRETTLRQPARAASHRTCMQTILSRITTPSFPTELNDQILDFLCPPVLPEFTLSSRAGWQTCMLYLHPTAGTLMVHSKNPSSETCAELARTIPHRYGIEQDIVNFQISRIMPWEAVSSRLHLLCNYHAPESTRWRTHLADDYS